MIKPISRRTLLRGAGVSLGLPCLEAMMPSTAVAQSATLNLPGRVAFLGYGIGMNMREFFPEQTGAEARLSRILQPLERFKSQLTAVSGTYLEHGGSHQGDYVMLTGNRGSTRSGIFNSISADQVVAKHIGNDTRFASLQLSIQRGTGYGHYMRTMSWSDDGIPLAAENDPHVLFRKLFLVETARDRLDRDKAFRRRGSIIDLVKGKARQMEQRVSHSDRHKLDEYLTSVRETESQLQRNLDWADRPKPEPNLTDSGDYSKPVHQGTPGFEYPEYARLMYDLMALAFQTDSTRVITYMVRTEAGEVFPCHETSNGFHALTHHNNDPKRLLELAQVDVVNMRFLARFLDRLQSVREPDGKTLLDRTMIATASGMGIDHSRDRLPIVLLGGSALGIKHQTHVKLTNKAPLSNVWRTMLNRLDVPVEGPFQDSTGIVNEVV